MMDFIWDARWSGNHGIARFAREVRSRIAEPKKDLAIAPIKPASALDPLFLSAELARHPELVFVSPGFNAALVTNKTQILVVHDLIHLDVAAERSPARTLFYSAVLRPTIRRARIVATVSEFSRARIRAWLRDDDVHVVNVGNGLSLAPQLERRRSSDLLFVGNNKPHKNLSLALAAFARLPEFSKLHIVGVQESSLSRNQWSALGSRHRDVIFHSTLSDHELGRLYAGVACLLLPSSYEGFGLTAIEALAQGTPVAYCCDAVGEVVGSFGARSSDNDPSEFASAVRTCAAFDENTLEQGRLRALQFDWSSVAARFDRLLESVGNVL